MRAALRVIFTKLELFLLRNQRTFVLTLSSCNNGSTDDENQRLSAATNDIYKSPYLEALLQGALQRPRQVSPPRRRRNSVGTSQVKLQSSGILHPSSKEQEKEVTEVKLRQRKRVSIQKRDKKITNQRNIDSNFFGE